MAHLIRKKMAHLIFFDRVLLGCVLLGLIILGGQLMQMQSRNAEIERQIGTFARHMAKAETRDTAAEDRDRALAQQIETLARLMAKAETRQTAAENRDKALAQQISAVVQQHTGQLDNIGAELTECVNKTAEH